MLPKIILCLLTVMLKWFYSNRDVSKAMHEDTLLDEEVFETCPERVPN